jgi:hypothetical protein
MKLLKILIFLICVLVLHSKATAQQTVTKTNPMPVYMHYMPWFDSPLSLGGNSWGWHWTMNNKNPNNIDPVSGKREIASHYYPLIGPYASNDPDVLEYHLLLMKLSGIDGVLIDWYGKQGSNGDIGNLLKNSNAIVDAAEKFGLKFAVVMEDRFSRNVDDAKANVTYLNTNYFTSPNYLRIDNHPLMAIFGPITFQTPAQWGQIFEASSEEIEFLTLWQESKDAGSYADGEYAWIWENDPLNNYLSNLEGYYSTTAKGLKTVMGVAYPGFMDFYKEGGAGEGYFEIPHDQGKTLASTLELANEYKGNFDILQLATWNDFGEGTIFEPTHETGFAYLQQLQQFTGVSYDVSPLLLVYKLYNLRKIHQGDAAKNAQLDQASTFLNNLEITEAKNILDTFETITGSEDRDSDSIAFEVFPNPLTGKTLHIKMTGKQNVQTVQVSITDIYGKLVVKESTENSNGTFSLSAEKLAPGVYTVNMQLTDKVAATRLIILD